MVFKAEDVLDRRDVIERIDRHGMTALIGGVPEQWREAIEVAQSASLGSLSTPRGVIALGMGGSAIGADLVPRSWLSRRRCPSR